MKTNPGPKRTVMIIYNVLDIMTVMKVMVGQINKPYYKYNTSLINHKLLLYYKSFIGKMVHSKAKRSEKKQIQIWVIYHVEMGTVQS